MKLISQENRVRTEQPQVWTCNTLQNTNKKKNQNKTKGLSLKTERNKENKHTYIRRTPRTANSSCLITTNSDKLIIKKPQDNQNVFFGEVQEMKTRSEIFPFRKIIKTPTFLFWLFIYNFKAAPPKPYKSLWFCLLLHKYMIGYYYKKGKGKKKAITNKNE